MSCKCPRCGLFSPDKASRCDCGYDFATKTTQSSYVVADILRKPGGREKFEQTARSNIWTGAILLALGAVVAGYSYFLGGGGYIWIAAVLWGASTLYRGWHQRQVLRGRRTNGIHDAS